MRNIYQHKYGIIISFNYRYKIIDMFFGRNYELNRLQELLEKPTASLVTCRGRRRIGKSTLFVEFARLNNIRMLNLEGLPPRKGMNNEAELRSFAEQLSGQIGKSVAVPDNWLSAFLLLDKEIQPKEKVLVLLDEISWMGKFDPDFAGSLKIAWDKHFKLHDNLILVLCGSVSAWITDNILKNTGFAGRRSIDLLLSELPLSDCVQFWGEAQPRTSFREIFDILSVTGGVPRYLEDFQPKYQANTNIRRMCFMPDGHLFNDFNDIFSEVFGDNAQTKRTLLDLIAEKPQTVSEIAKHLGKECGGHLTDHLEELQLAGFISEDSGMNPETGKPSLFKRYRLKDNYTRFYLKCIEPHRQRIEKRLFDFTSLKQLDGWNTILGLQFENLIVNNFHALLPRIGLGDVTVLSSAPFRKTSGATSPGCQIDLLIQTECAYYIVEIKRKGIIGNSIIGEMERKAKSLPVRKNVSIRKVLVYEGQLAGKTSQSGYFDFIIPASELLKPLP